MEILKSIKEALSSKSPQQELKELKRATLPFPDVAPSRWDVNGQDALTPLLNEKGEWPTDELAKRTFKRDGETLLDDAGVTFRKKNGEWVPLPLENRELTDEQFANHTHEAILEMTHHPVYGKKVEAIIKKTGLSRLIATIIAIAKQESGGKPLGQFEFHRWEKNHKAFSFSIMHILDVGPGFRARKTLRLSQGQMYHPKNAIKVFLGFLAEKSNTPEAYLPLDEKLDAFSTFYNGNWQVYNPNYPKRVNIYYQQAKALMRLENQPVNGPFAYAIGHESLKNALQNANVINAGLYPNEKITSFFLTDQNAARAYGALRDYLKRNKWEPKSTDSIAVWLNKEGRVYMTYQRNGQAFDIGIRPAIEPLKSKKTVEHDESGRAFVGMRGDISDVKRAVYATIREANFKVDRPIRLDPELESLAGRVVKYISDMGIKLEREDQIAVGKDEKGTYVIFKRSNAIKAILRV